jgi:hypothetical protein
MSAYFYSYTLPSAAWSMDEKQILDEAEDLVLSYPGSDFLDDISRYLANTLKMDYVFIARMVGEEKNRVRTEAFYGFGQKQPNLEYELKNTPCGMVVGSRLCYYPQGVQSIYPKDKLLRELYIESYIGQPLFSLTGDALGLIVLMHREIIPQAGFVEALLASISLRVEQELRFKLFQ